MRCLTQQSTRTRQNRRALDLSVRLQMITRLILTIALALWSCATLSQELAPLKSIEHVEGCSCELYLRGDNAKLLLQSEINGNPAWVNLDGVDTKLNLVGSTQPKKIQLGSNISRKYSAANQTIFAKYSVSRTCAPKTECDGFGVNGTVSVNGVSKPGKSYPVQGLCAC